MDFNIREWKEWCHGNANPIYIGFALVEIIDNLMSIIRSGSISSSSSSVMMMIIIYLFIYLASFRKSANHHPVSAGETTNPNIVTKINNPFKI